jgi:glucoamylase
LNITTTSLAFFQVFSSSADVGTYASTTSIYTNLTTAIKSYADDFVQIVAKYTPSGGGLAEQYSKSDGTPLSAVDLTWSYASAITAFQARNGTVPASWGASGLTVPSECLTNAVAVTFNVQATTVFGGEWLLLAICSTLAENCTQKTFT